jgi:putative ATP-binding cassette transporter
MNILSFLLRRSRGTFLVAVLAGVLSGLGGAALLGVVNDALQRPEAGAVLAWAFAGLCALLVVTRVISNVLLVRVGEDSVLDIRLDLIRKILGTPLQKLEELGMHRLTAALTDDTQAIANALMLLPTIGINLLVVALSLVYLGWLSLQVLAAFLVVMTVAAVSYGLLVKWTMRLYRRAREAQDGLFGQFRLLTEGNKELKLHAPRRGAFVAGLERTARSLRDQYVHGASIAGAGQAWGQLLVFVAVGFLVFALPQLLPVDRATLTGYALVIFYIMSPFQYVLQSMPFVGRGSIALDRLEKLGLSLDAAPAAALPAVPPAWRSLELSGVLYGYHRSGEDAFAVGPISLVIHPGEVIFLVGGNGSGKTTLAKVLCGLYMPEDGEIRLDGRPVTAESLDAYRQLFSTVFSDFCLFDSLLGLEGTDLDQRARGYLAELQLDRKVSVKDGALSTTALSQGQRKRLALLTAYLEDRPIYIFDEWAADQDPVFKEIFYHRILPELRSRGKAVVAISHDDRYFDVADRLVRLEEGRLKREEIASPVLA